MSRYSIHFLEELTGIKAHTMRIWEQRYNLLKPQRTQTKIRYYSDEDLKKLLNISTLLDAGYRIGDLSVLSTEELHLKLDSLHQNSDNTLRNTADINDFIAAAMLYDETGFTRVYNRAMQRLGIEKVYTDVIYPMIVRIGALWTVSKVNPAQEHFISNLLRQKLFAGINELKTPKESTWVLFLPENEMHELGLLFSTFLLRYHGHKTIYLGQNVPYSSLEETILTTQPHFILYFQVKHTPAEETAALINKLSAKFGKIQKVLCAPAPFVANLHKPDNYIFLSSPEQFIDWFKHTSWKKQLS